jgi:uncharacterized protein (TIGR00106 family)
MLLLELSIAPLGKGASVGKYVARALDVIDKSGLDYELHAMGTVLEGEWDRVMAVVKKCFDAVRRDCDRVSVSIKADRRKGRAGALRSKVRSVEKALGRTLRTRPPSAGGRFKAVEVKGLTGG